jgi:hypothetical protein
MRVLQAVVQTTEGFFRVGIFLTQTKFTGITNYFIENLRSINPTEIKTISSTIKSNPPDGLSSGSSALAVLASSSDQEQSRRTLCVHVQISRGESRIKE